MHERIVPVDSGEVVISRVGESRKLRIQSPKQGLLLTPEQADDYQAAITEAVEELTGEFDMYARYSL